ncbi:MAG: ABC transporter ATP-binding protein/permease [Verrucomicrobia bacterium]|nr:ABC transporter ATP-binding protein/permease [Verrucomicrobiota bacterium]
MPKNTRTSRAFELLEQFGLKEYSDDLAADLPLGIRQRLSLAVAVIHKPELLILDEPTSGVDPIGRDHFWELLIELSRRQNVTIFISTHFMNEAQRCDRLALMHAGKVLACDKPETLVKAHGSANLEDAFVALLEKASRAQVPLEKSRSETPTTSGTVHRALIAPTRQPFSLRRMLAYARRENLEILRDHIRLAFALIAPVLLMLVCGYGITFDVEHNSYAVLDRDQTFGSRDFLDNIAGSTYFNEHSPIHDYSDLERRMQSGELRLAIEIPPLFSEDLKRGRVPELAVWIDGAMPFRGETIRSYIEKLSQQYLLDLAHHNFWPAPPVASPTLQFRYRYNQDFRSINAVVPSELAILLIFIPSLSTAVGVVREKVDAAVRFAFHHGRIANDSAFWWQHSGGFDALCVTDNHAVLSIDALRQHCPGHSLPRRWT